MKLSVLTLVRGREGHLRQLVEGLRRSRRPPDELVVVDMGEGVPTELDADFPIRVERLGIGGLALAAARNLAARRATGEMLLFLDVDCIPMADCLGRMADTLVRHDGLLCADVRYLGPDDARGSWTESELLALGRAHPVRAFPAEGARVESDPGLFWSLAFAIRRRRFEALGGFDEDFVGYGGEDTDFGFRAAAAGVPLLFVGGALACHQHHPSHDPPVQYFTDIVRNARLFRAKWGRWPMEGWLDAFAALGLIDRTADILSVRRHPTTADLDATRVTEAFGPPATDAKDRIAGSPVPSA